MTGGVKLEVCFEEDAEFCRRFMQSSYSERIVMLAMVFAKQADGTWMELTLGKPKVKIYERHGEGSKGIPITVNSGVPSKDPFIDAVEGDF